MTRAHHGIGLIRVLCTLLVLAMLAAACGGDGDTTSAGNNPFAPSDDGSDPDPDDQPEPEPTAEPTEQPEPEPEPEPRGDVTEFCFAAAKVGEAGEILDLIDGFVPAELEFGVTRMQQAIDAAIPLAPDADTLASLEEAKAEWDPIVNILDVVDYDLANAQPVTVENFTERAERSDALFDRLEVELGGLLENDCGIPLSQIETNAADAYGLFFGQAEPTPTLVPVPTATTPPVQPPTGTINVFDDTGTIQLSVPSSWSDTLTEFPADGITRFIAAEDVVGYEESWEVPGTSVAYVTGLSLLTDDEILEQAQAFSQCLLVDTGPYTDPLYTGTLDTYEDCPSGGQAAVLVARSDLLPDAFILVEIQFAAGDTTSLRTVLDSFVVTG